MVQGNGFKKLGSQDIYCSFGGVANRKLSATFINSTFIECQAPRVSTFDPCVAVPLEIAFGGVKSYTSNNILVSQVNIPQVTPFLYKRGPLVHTMPLAVNGRGFVNTDYLACIIDNEVLQGQFISSTLIFCDPSAKTAAVRTTVEVTLDGQLYSSNAEKYFFVGDPATMSPYWKGTAPFAPQTNTSKSSVELPVLHVDFLDAAGTDVRNRDAPLRGHKVSVALFKTVMAPMGPQHEQLLGMKTVDITVGAAKFDNLAFSYPGAGTYTFVLNTSYASVATTNITFVIVPVATALKFGGPFSYFTTNRRSLDGQPKVLVVDDGSNVVTTESTAIITASVAPTPECQGVRDPAIYPDTTNGTALWEAGCARISGNSATASNGIAQFETLYFVGVEGVIYNISFGTTIVPQPIVSPPMYVAVCPSTLQLDHIEPDWISDQTGGNITAKGWDYQPNKPLQLQIGTESVNCTYIDTCTANCVFTPQNASAILARRAKSLALTTASALSVTLLDTSSGTSSATVNFRVKSSTTTQLGYSISAQTIYAGLSTFSGTAQTATTAAARTCVYSTTTVPAETAALNAIDCYTAATSLNIRPVFAVQQDAAGGDIFHHAHSGTGFGWKSTNVDVDVTMTLDATLTTAVDTRTQSAMFNGRTNFTVTTSNGFAAIVDLTMASPQTGDYAFKFSSSSTTTAGSAFTSTTYIIRISQGEPVVLALYDLALSGANSTGGRVAADGSARIERGDSKALNLEFRLLDSCGNSVGIDNTDVYSTLAMKTSVAYWETIMPPPMKNLSIAGTTGLVTQGIAGQAVWTLQDPSLSLTRVDLATVFDLSQVKVNNIFFGYTYQLTFTIPALVSPHNNSIGAVTVNMVAANCGSDNAFGQNNTNNCRGANQGGAPRGATNHSMWLFSDPGFWRYHNIDDTFYECPLDTNCLGGFHSQCVEGAELITCAVCQIGYGKQGKQCLKCASFGVNVFVLCVVIIGVFVVIVIMVKANLSTEVKPKSIFSIIIKILLNHLQTATLMQDFQAKAKGIARDLTDEQGKAMPSTNFANFHCLTNWSMYDIFLMWMIIPVLVLGIPGIVSCIASVVRHFQVKKKHERLREEFDRRQALGLPLDDLELHRLALELDTLPDQIFVQEDESMLGDDEEFELETDDEDVEAEVDPEADIHEALAEERAARAAEKMQALQKKRKRIERRLLKVAKMQADAATAVMADPNAPQELTKDASAVLRQNEIEGDDVDTSRPLPSAWTAHRNNEDKLYYRHSGTGKIVYERPTHDTPKSDTAVDMGAVVVTDGDEDMFARAEDAPVKQEGLERCMQCKTDFAMYACDSCAEGSFFCEDCWAITHSKHGPNAMHERKNIKIGYEETRTVQPQHERLYDEVMEERSKVPALEIWIVTVLVVIFLVYPSLMTQIAMMMKCIKIESVNRYFLAADMRIECTYNTGDKYLTYYYIAWGFFMLYGIGIPVAGTILLATKRKSLIKKTTLSTYGFLYSGYSMTKFFWEFVIMFRKMAIVFIIVFYAGQPDYSIMFGMWLVTAFLMLNIFIQPFQRRLFWRLENFSLSTVSVTLNAAMLYQPRFAMGPDSDLAVTIFIFIINLGVLILFAYYLVVALKMQLLVVIDLDGDGELSWNEFKLCCRHHAYQNHHEKMVKWGFEIDDPSEEIAVMTAKKNLSKKEAILAHEEELAAIDREGVAAPESKYEDETPMVEE
jgi:hypothetical protein